MDVHSATRLYCLRSTQKKCSKSMAKNCLGTEPCSKCKLIVPSSTSKLKQPNSFNQQAGPIINQQRSNQLASWFNHQPASWSNNQLSWFNHQPASSLGQSSTSKLVQSSTSSWSNHQPASWFKAGLLYLNRTSCNSTSSDSPLVIASFRANK